MERPGAGLVGSIVVHAAVVGLFAFGVLSARERAPLDMTTAVPVSIVSETVVIEAAAPDNPSEELVTDDAATAPVETPPEPVPPEPTPTPPAPRPDPTPPRRPAPVPEKAQPRPTPPRTQPTPPRAEPTPPRAQPTPPRPQPTPPREQGLDLDALAGPPRPSTRPGQRPWTGRQGRGSAPRAVGRVSLQALGAQVRPRLNCDLPGASSTTVRVVVRLSEGGRIVGTPRLQGDRNPISESVLRAIQAAEPFDMPSDYEEQDIPFVFNTGTWC